MQRRRELPTRLMQRLQAAMQRGLEQGGGDAQKPWPVRVLEKLPPFRELRTRLIAYGGFKPERVAALPLEAQLRGARRQQAA